MGSTSRDTALLAGGICTTLACFISAYTVAVHLVQTRHPSLKQYTIRIVLMVPIYALEAIFAIQHPTLATFLAVLRSCYEAFALFSFMQLMLSYLSLDAPSQGDGTRGAIWIAMDMTGDPQVPHMWPLCRAQLWPMGPIFLRRTLVGVFQYTAVMPLVTAVVGITSAAGCYGDGEVDNWTKAYPYLALVQNFSQCWALYCLVLFYKATASRLEAVRPLAKFVSIKMVVFFTW